MFRFSPLPAFLFFLIVLSGCSPEHHYARDFMLMDTFVRIEARGPLSMRRKKQAVADAASRMKELEKKFDYFSETGELAAINRLKAGDVFAVSDEMFTVLKTARDICKKTEGAFDISASPGVRGGCRLWGLNGKRKTVRIKKNGIKLNLGGIAKGFIVDEGAEVLKKAGIQDGLINAGGDICCMGFGRNRNEGWKIGIRDPANPRRVLTTLTVRDKGIATSGGYARFVKAGSKTFSHIVDPRTGNPVAEIRKSVTVVARNCMIADALATALYVMAPHEGLALIEGMGPAECIIIREDGRFVTSSGIKNGIITCSSEE